MICSNYNKNQKRKLIGQVVDQIAAGFRPQKIILFGSYAYGKVNDDSDVDLLVVMESKKRPPARAVEVSKAIQYYPFAMDIMVRTPDEIRKRLRLKDPFFIEVIEKGKVLYEQ
ncbi:MAG: hypothetical protein A3G33_06775 [Omnitrophica bacterium RIFCSPLOWO2_12_FULL_44_17]|uniref:Polymerase nucleotidyl transferase domain-containing protein n=1 Tax=Candidatus Danuiimicrobium aquiferis TaxID=1801832 RepID=A0A1G1L2K1_9BACT|nr:MAG: hypothetical protein A3B72_03355 [Omnitrophica bacterium RIFCSPHIGHO2_02_FULL_45_28]OGW99385.1 MAG: hypothetical protein A3G33_06775 [Omnitrophica bacterium RIFCSPLOWO2_12_FULL_44_17]OGX03429.1 MAG: hypothetical protein A3J12_11660 [Omnitrophica bacterium RIFCSPLOWO2_02_FULL_44_11]